jgi:hypothetical protein
MITPSLFITDITLLILSLLLNARLTYVSRWFFCSSGRFPGGSFGGGFGGSSGGSSLIFGCSNYGSYYCSASFYYCIVSFSASDFFKKSISSYKFVMADAFSSSTIGFVLTGLNVASPGLTSTCKVGTLFCLDRFEETNS